MKKILLMGVLIRVFLMPIFAHGDIIAVHKRVEAVVCQGKSVLSFGSVGVHGLESFFSLIFKPLIPCSILSGIQEDFYAPPFLNRMLFFFKLPYLFFELGYWWLIFRIFKNQNKEGKRKIALFLAFNPIMIYSVYIFGRFETYQIFFSALILLILEIKSKVSKMVSLTSLLMGLILTIRQSYLLILPALAAAFGGITLAGISSFGLAGGLYGLVRGFQRITGQSTSFFPEAAWIKEGVHPGYFFQAAIDISQERLIYFFFLMIGIIFVWWLQKKEGLMKIGKKELFSLFSALIFLSYYATSIFHPQYLTWLLPFFLVLIVKDNFGFLWRSFWWSTLFYFIYSLSWGNHTTFGTLFPVSLAFKQIEPGWFLPIFPLIQWANIGRTIFSAFCLYWFFYLIRNYEKNS